MGVGKASKIVTNTFAENMGAKDIYRVAIPKDEYSIPDVAEVNIEYIAPVNGDELIS